MCNEDDLGFITNDVKNMNGVTISCFDHANLNARKKSSFLHQRIIEWLGTLGMGVWDRGFFFFYLLEFILEEREVVLRWMMCK